ncbi:MAG: hypothetical protein Q7U57_06345 [Methylovulum sp.]|nr:hypothetical protein [Methylovulum sp.]
MIKKLSNHFLVGFENVAQKIIKAMISSCKIDSGRRVLITGVIEVALLAAVYKM